MIMAVDKRCATNGRYLQAKSAASEIQRVKNTFAENFSKSKQIHARKTVCGDEFATISLTLFIVFLDLQMFIFYCNRFIFFVREYHTTKSVVQKHVFED